MTKISKKAFSLIELMMVIAIIGILSAVIVVNLNGAKTKSRNRAAFTQIMSTQAMVYKCIRSGINDPVKGKAVLGNINQEAQPICVYENTGEPVPGFPDKWPVLPEGWNYGYALYCGLTSTPGEWAHPPAGVLGVDYGYNITQGKFCYGIHSPRWPDAAAPPVSLFICTEKGCWACTTIVGGGHTCSNMP